MRGRAAPGKVRLRALSPSASLQRYYRHADENKNSGDQLPRQRFLQGSIEGFVVRELNSTDRRIRERAGEFNRQVVRAVGLQGFAYESSATLEGDWRLLESSTSAVVFCGSLL